MASIPSRKLNACSFRPFLVQENLKFLARIRWFEHGVSLP
jgi:hypothetical protein